MVLEALPSDELDTSCQSAQSQTSQCAGAAAASPKTPEQDSRDHGHRPLLENHSTPLEAIANPHAFVEATADELMHDVFDDVDRMLDKGLVVPPNQPSQAEADKRDFAAVPHPSGGALAAIQETEGSTFGSHSSKDAEGALKTTKDLKLGTVLVRLTLIVIASMGLGIGLAWWMAQRHQAELAQSVATQSTETAVATSGSETDGFLNYIVESLEAIDRRYELRARAGESLESSALGEGDNAAAIADEPNSDGSINGIERVYIPVYQPPQGTGTLPPLASAPLDQVATATAPTPQGSNTPDPVQNISPDNTHTLVGTLELGDRSAAIFEYAGSAHRIEVGEQIGSSGWSLVSVAGNEATIRRNGDVRTIFMQQSF